jgi:hypothetical protein
MHSECPGGGSQAGTGHGRWDHLHIQFEFVKRANLGISPGNELNNLNRATFNGRKLAVYAEYGMKCGSFEIVYQDVSQDVSYLRDLFGCHDPEG